MMVLAVNEDQVTPGVVAFFIVAALGLTLFFLIRSMNKQIRKIEAPSEEELRQADWERRQKESAESSAESKEDKRDA
ncbi:hypothetical protein GCM10023196_059480 [Actinoallomurus vinaceus]|uniref:Uncharacterized protein n=1 Tax=Actinoallomurus vinaceus TaxID=1080074 RepID=A0ABP8UFU8_9ACTN